MRIWCQSTDISVAPFQKRDETAFFKLLLFSDAVFPKLDHCQINWSHANKLWFMSYTWNDLLFMSGSNIQVCVYYLRIHIQSNVITWCNKVKRNAFIFGFKTAYATPTLLTVRMMKHLWDDIHYGVVFVWTLGSAFCFQSSALTDGGSHSRDLQHRWRCCFCSRSKAASRASPGVERSFLRRSASLRRLKT